MADPPGEAVFLRDEDAGVFWSATPAPAPSESAYVVRYGAGFAAYEHGAHGIRSELLAFVPGADPVKLLRLRLNNLTSDPRRVSATLYVEWVLGDARSRTRAHVTTWIDDKTGALCARNPFRQDFGDRVAFVQVNQTKHTATADRTDFIGRNGSLADPAMRHAQLSERVGAGLDPCGALQVTVTLEPRASVELVFQLGEGEHEDEARRLAMAYTDGAAVEVALENVQRAWNERLETIQTATPDPTMNRLVNRWLLYQTVACRMWGRTGFYQSSGAFGFRDQLQDALSLLFAAPELARAHILYAATRQFTEGDVQHSDGRGTPWSGSGAGT